MPEMNRRLFLQLTAGGAVGLAAASALSSSAPRMLERSANSPGSYTFRAVAGLPAKPIPAYASYVLEGKVDLAKGTGIVTRTIFAGAPEAMSAIPFPGLLGTARVTSVERLGDSLRLKGLIEESETQSEAQSSRSKQGASIDIYVDPSSGVVSTNWLEPDISLKLAR